MSSVRRLARRSGSAGAEHSLGGCHVPRDLRVVRIQNELDGASPQVRLNLEYVVIANLGTTKENVAGWTLEGRTAAGERRHRYRFPLVVAGRAYTLDPGELIYVVTGTGVDQFRPANTQGDPESRPHFDFHQNLSWSVWGNGGDIAALYDSHDLLVAEATVPSPLRRP